MLHLGVGERAGMEVFEYGWLRVCDIQILAWHFFVFLVHRTPYGSSWKHVWDIAEHSIEYFSRLLLSFTFPHLHHYLCPHPI